MITLRTRIHVDRLTGEQVYGFLMNATDHEYQEWWPGVHLHLHTLKRYPNNNGNIVYMDGHADNVKHRSLRASDFGLTGGTGVTGQATDTNLSIKGNEPYTSYHSVLD